MKRLGELISFSWRVVSRPVKVTAIGYIEQESCAIVRIPAKIGPIAVTLAQGKDQGGDSLRVQVWPLYEISSEKLPL
jgi:hypothetical protein